MTMSMSMGGGETKRRRANWSEFPSELLELILEKLSFSDIVRFKSVCSVWNRVAQSYITSSFYESLLLQTITKHPQDNINCNRFFSLQENKDYELKNLFGEFGDDAWCVGSTRGWSVVLDTKLIFHLLNPFSRAKIQLPVIPPYLQKPGMLPKDYIHKAILFSNPCDCGNNNFTLVVAFRMVIKSRLAFCNYRVNKWIHFGRDKDEYLDIIGNNQRQLYALTNKDLHLWNFHRRGGAYPKLVKKFKCSTPLSKLTPFPNSTTSPLAKYSFGCYLVESLGEILLVLLQNSQHLNKGLSTSQNRTMEFSVYKVDSSLEEWVSVKTLLDRDLFIRENETLSVSTLDFLECQEILQVCI